MVIPRSYFERFETKKYRSRNPLQRVLISRFIDGLHRLFLASGDASRVLEVGCGEGFVSGYLSERYPGVGFTGIDVDPLALSRLKEKFPRVETHRGSACDLSEVAGAFDLVICCEVLEHLDDPAAALREIAARSPRRALFTVPHEPWFRLSNFLRGKNLARLGDDIGHVNHWGPRSFRRLLESNFEVLELTRSYPWLLSLSKPR